MKFLSVCSGIEAASVACKHLDWEAIGFSEIEDFPNKVLAYHYPNVKNYGDIRNIQGEDFNGRTDLLVGGTPCTEFSVSGNRKGLDGEHSVLAREYVRLLREVRPRWFVWENVPGALSTNEGRDYASLLKEMEELGYGVAGRILDAKNFGVPQNRRRIFLVGYLGDWRPPFGVLFERESVCGNTGKVQNKEQATTSCIGGCIESESGQRDRPVICMQKNAVRINGGCQGKGWKDDETCYTLTTANPHVVLYEAHHTDSRYREVSTCPTLTRRNDPGGNNLPLVVETNISIHNPKFMNGSDNETRPTLLSSMNKDPYIVYNKSNSVKDVETFAMKSFSEWTDSDKSSTLRATGGNYGGGSESVISDGSILRKLTPIECERLQGFPDNYTNIPYNGKDVSPKSKRYMALGNSIAVPVLKWIFDRIDLMDKIIDEREIDL